MNFKRLILILCAGSMAGWADNNAAVRGPVTGYIFDAQARAIRPMMGLPGAAYLGAPLVSGVDAASVSPDGSAAMTVQGGQLTFYQGFGSARPAVVPVKGAVAAGYFAWSPSSTAAAVYSPAAKQAQVFTNLLAAPPAGAAIDLSGLAGQVTAMAFDGQHIILAVASPVAGGIYVATVQSGPQLVASAVSPLGIVVAGADLYFADNQAQQIWQVRSYATRPAPVLFAADMSISSPAALQLSSDGARLYVANAGSRTLGVYDVAARSPVESLALNFTPTALDRFGNASVFLLDAGGRGNGPLYVLTDTLDRRAVYFVPGAEGAHRPPPLHYKPL
jgi:hypothetical protein